MHLEQVVKAPRDQVFQTFTDYEAWPRFSGLVTRVTVTERAGDSVHLDMEIKVMGRKFKRTEEHVLTPPEQVLVEGETVVDQHVLVEIRSGTLGDPGEGSDRSPAQGVVQTYGAIYQPAGANLVRRVVASLGKVRGAAVADPRCGIAVRTIGLTAETWGTQVPTIRTPGNVFDGDPYELGDAFEGRGCTVLEAIRRFVAEFGVLPTADSWTAAGMVPTERTILRRFGSLSSAFSRAGLV